METANFYDQDGGYYLYSTPFTGGYPPENSTLVKLPSKPWAENKWPKFDGRSWTFFDDIFEKEYWPSGSTWITEPEVMRQHRPLPNGASLTKPEKPFEIQKEEKKQELNSKFQTAQISGHIDSSVGFPVNATSSMTKDIDDLIMIIEMIGSDTIQFRDFENKMHDVTLIQLKTIKLEIAQYLQTIFQKKWSYATAIENAKTVKDLNSINISF